MTTGQGINLESHLESNLLPHVVQFYSDDGFLLDTLAQFVGGALLGGDAAVIIATRQHRDGLLQRLRDRGLQTSGALTQGRLVLADAAFTLGRFMVESWPDEKKFVKVISPLIEQARAATTSRQHRVAAFGEMVALLWAEGKHEAALRLEEIWNDLAKTNSFSLRCAYPVSSFSSEADGSSLLRVCAEHSHIIPAETYSHVAERERLRNVIEAKRKTG